MTTIDFYNSMINALPVAQRLHMATLILSDIPPQSVVDYSEEWNDEDLQDFSANGWRHIEKKMGEENA